MTLHIPAKVLLHVWSYDFYDMTLSTGKQRRHMINGPLLYCNCHEVSKRTKFWMQTLLFLQILCLAEQIRFSENCEAAIKQGLLQNYCREIEGQLESYTSVDLTEAGQDEDTQVILLYRFLFKTLAVII